VPTLGDLVILSVAAQFSVLQIRANRLDVCADRVQKRLLESLQSSPFCWPNEARFSNLRLCALDLGAAFWRVLVASWTIERAHRGEHANSRP
jgi:hypothetical protein